MINPNKYVRLAYVTALKEATGLPVYDTRIPISVDPVPSKYILLHSQTLQPTATSKTCYEWECTIVVDINSVQPQGNTSSVIVDDIQEQVITAVESLTGIPPFQMKSKKLENQYAQDVETDSASIQRRVLTYSHWLNRIL